MRVLGDFYGPGSTQEALKKTLDELNKPGGHISKAQEAFVNFSPKGSLDLVEKANSVLGAITTAALQKSTVKHLLPKALDDLIVTANNLKRTLSGGVAGAVTP